MATITNWRDHLPADSADELFDLDADWQDECTPEHLCEECVAADRDEAALLAQVDATDEALIDLGQLAIAADRPWKEGGRAA